MPRLYVGIVIEKAVAGLRLPTVWGSFVGLKPSSGWQSLKSRQMARTRASASTQPRIRVHTSRVEAAHGRRRAPTQSCGPETPASASTQATRDDACPEDVRASTGVR